ncbi:MAG: hypothetical protein ACN4GZ_15695 [Acidimicrobiales bacterium]
MPSYPLPAFDHYWAMWNETDPGRIRSHLDRAVSEDVEFCDPLHWHFGKDALEANVRQFRSDQPDAVFVLVSGFDHHNNRYRYRWDFTRRGRTLLEGLDITTVNDDGLIMRIDGFFGDLPAAGGGSEKPAG